MGVPGLASRSFEKIEILIQEIEQILPFLVGVWENFEKLDSKLCILEPFFCIKSSKNVILGGTGACPPGNFDKWTLNN